MYSRNELIRHIHDLIHFSLAPILDSDVNHVENRSSQGLLVFKKLCHKFDSIGHLFI